MLLNLFQFRGVLSNFKLKVDEVLLEEILTPTTPTIDESNENELN